MTVLLVILGRDAVSSQLLDLKNNAELLFLKQQIDANNKLEASHIDIIVVKE